LPIGLHTSDFFEENFRKGGFSYFPGSDLCSSMSRWIF
jgi:hypothetical protein